MAEQATSVETDEQTTTEAEALSFSNALKLLKDGRRVARYGWNGKSQCIELQTPDENSKMGLPYIFISTVNKKLVPWIASQTDLLADDWYKVT